MDEGDEDVVGRLRLQLRLERAAHAETSRKLEALEARFVIAEKRCVAEGALVGPEKLLEVVMSWLGPGARLNVAATGRSWLASLGSPMRRRVGREHHAEVRLSPTLTSVTVEDDVRFSEWLSLLPLKEGGGPRLVALKKNDRRQHRKSSKSMDDAAFSEDDEEDEWPPEIVSYSASDPPVRTRDDEAIELDLNRTDSADVGPLRRCLRLVVARRSHVGYCQGMNFVAAFLLRRSSGGVDAAAEIYDRLFDSLDLASLYGDGMPALQLLLYQLEALLKLHAKDLADHLADLKLSASFYAAPWFVTLLVNFLPDDDAIVAWDELVSAIAAADNLPPPPWLLKKKGATHSSLRRRPTRSRQRRRHFHDDYDDPLSEGDSGDDTLKNTVIPFIGAAFRMRVPPHREDDNDDNDDDDGFASSAAAQGWAVIFRVILVCLRAATPSILTLGFETTLRYLQDFPASFRRRDSSLAALLKQGEAAILEHDRTLAHQLTDLRTNFRDALEAGIIEDLSEDLSSPRWQRRQKTKKPGDKKNALATTKLNKTATSSSLWNYYYYSSASRNTTAPTRDTCSSPSHSFSSSPSKKKNNNNNDYDDDDERPPIANEVTL